MGRSTQKPFVVCSTSTKRYAPRAKIAPTWNPPPIPASTHDGSSAPRWTPTKEKPGSNGAIGEKKLPSFPAVACEDQSVLLEMFATQPSMLVKKLKDGEIMGGFQESVRSTQFTGANEPVFQSCCVTHRHISWVCAGASTTSEEKQGSTPKTAGRVKTPRAFVKKPSVVDMHRSEVLTRHQRLTPSNQTIYPCIEWSPPPSPDMTSFLGQSWTIVDVDDQRSETPTTVCDDKTSTTGHTPTAGIFGVPGDFCCPFDSISSSPLRSSSPTVIATPPSPAKSLAGPENPIKIGKSTREAPSVEASPAICAATIVPPSSNGTTSIATLAKVLDKSQTKSPSTHTKNGTRMAVCCAIEIVRSLFAFATFVAVRCRDRL